MNRQQAELEAVCDSCLQLIDDDEGHVWINLTEALSAAARATPPPAAQPVDLHDFLAESDGVPWHTTHTLCRMADHTYAIPVADLRTWYSLLRWSQHLTGKSWVTATDWQLFVDRALEKGAPHIGLRPTARPAT